MANDYISIAGLAALVGALFGSGGLYAWFKLGPERGQITVNIAKDAVLLQSGVLKEIEAQYKGLKEELQTVKMEAETAEQAHEACRTEINEMKLSISYLQRDLDRHGQVAVLSRRKTHLALNTIGSYEILCDNILGELRDRSIPIKDTLRPQIIRTAFQERMNELERLEDELLSQAINTFPSPPAPSSSQ